MQTILPDDNRIADTSQELSLTVKKFNFEISKFFSAKRLP